MGAAGRTDSQRVDGVSIRCELLARARLTRSHRSGVFDRGSSKKALVLEFNTSRSLSAFDRYRCRSWSFSCCTSSLNSTDFNCASASSAAAMVCSSASVERHLNELSHCVALDGEAAFQTEWASTSWPVREEGPYSNCRGSLATAFLWRLSTCTRTGPTRRRR